MARTRPVSEGTNIGAVAPQGAKKIGRKARPERSRRGIDLPSVLRRVEQIAKAGRMATGNTDATLSITFRRLDTLADDLRKGLHSSDGAVL